MKMWSESICSISLTNVSNSCLVLLMVWSPRQTTKSKCTFGGERGRLWVSEITKIRVFRSSFGVDLTEEEGLTAAGSPEVVGDIVANVDGVPDDRSPMLIVVALESADELDSVCGFAVNSDGVFEKSDFSTGGSIPAGVARVRRCTGGRKCW